LINADGQAALSSHHEDGNIETLTRKELKERVTALAGWMQSQGVIKGDRVAAYIPNIQQAVETMLAAASLGAIYSSCSPDFGFNGVFDRFSQIEPKLLVTVDGYFYAGKKISRVDVIRQLKEKLPSLVHILVHDYSGNASDLVSEPEASLYSDALKHSPVEKYTPVKFNDPLYILYSSGTTGAPKCIVHSVGGTLLQHIKEHRLHSNITKNASVFYFTTCGWMMWNWLVSSLAIQAKIVLFEGNPFYPGPERIWEMAEQEKLYLLGTSAKFIDASRKSGIYPEKIANLTNLKVICSTGSPLNVEGFDFIYKHVKSNVQLASISGGTDIVSCFVLGCPIRPVYAGEIQCRGLGMDVVILSEQGLSLKGEQGELCCKSAFPSMPIGFWNDPDGSKYHSAYFEMFDNVWRHGDWATLSENDGIIIHGRSDATLNPGGVRIGTAEIYRPVESFNEILEALVIGQNINDDVRIILFVRLKDGIILDDELKNRLKKEIKAKATPRHVPEVIIAVEDIPRTRSGKITELAVRDVIHDKDVKNTEALANPEALELFKNLPELVI
ncbi:acetoacetate--CoA ligase, partial [Alphaproteobacteria bacterium]|nr:acetoacetate--CoA ligase [Alphaproteobacteria bacterium]